MRKRIILTMTLGLKGRQADPWRVGLNKSGAGMNF